MIRKIIDQQAVERTKCLEELKKMSHQYYRRSCKSVGIRGAASQR